MSHHLRSWQLTTCNCPSFNLPVQSLHFLTFLDVVSFDVSSSFLHDHVDVCVCPPLLLHTGSPLHSGKVSYLSTHRVYQYKIQFLIILGGYGHNYWKMDTGRYHFHEIWCCFKLSKKIEKLLNEQPALTIAKCTLTGLVQ